MYFYTGKSLDTFEAAMNMLLMNNQYEFIPDLDCIGMRNCSMIHLNKMSQWFQPAINTMKSLKYIEEALSVEGLFEVRKVNESNLCMMWKDDRPFVLGLVNKKKLFHKIDVNYYDGNRNYLYCFQWKGKRVIHEPDGAPFLLCDDKDVKNFMNGREYLYQIFINRNKKLQLVERKAILQAWLKCKYANSNNPNEIQNYDYSKINHLSASNEIELQFGLHNYMIQTYKIIRFLFKNSGNEESSRIFQKYSNIIADIAINKSICDLQKVLREMNDSLVTLIMEEINI